MANGIMTVQVTPELAAQRMGAQVAQPIDVLRVGLATADQARSIGERLASGEVMVAVSGDCGPEGAEVWTPDGRQWRIARYVLGAAEDTDSGQRSRRGGRYAVLAPATAAPTSKGEQR